MIYLLLILNCFLEKSQLFLRDKINPNLYGFNNNYKILIKKKFMKL